MSSTPSRTRSRTKTFGEVPPLTWGRIDLRRGAILPDRNKTGDTSLTPLEPDLVCALKIWKTMSTKTGADDPAFVTRAGEPIEPREATDAYRASLRAALVAEECNRPELWTAGHGRRTLRLHDARASFVTVALVNGRSEDWGRRRSEHKSSAIERYRRELGTSRELNLGDWGPLDEAIPEFAPVVADEKAQRAARGDGCGSGCNPAGASRIDAASRPQKPKGSGVSGTSRGERIRTSDP